MGAPGADDTELSEIRARFNAPEADTVVPLAWYLAHIVCDEVATQGNTAENTVDVKELDFRSYTVETHWLTEFLDADKKTRSIWLELQQRAGDGRGSRTQTLIHVLGSSRLCRANVVDTDLILERLNNHVLNDAQEFQVDTDENPMAEDSDAPWDLFADVTERATDSLVTCGALQSECVPRRATSKYLLQHAPETAALKLAVIKSAPLLSAPGISPLVRLAAVHAQSQLQAQMRATLKLHVPVSFNIQPPAHAYSWSYHDLYDLLRETGQITMPAFVEELRQISNESAKQVLAEHFPVRLDIVKMLGADMIDVHSCLCEADTPQNREKKDACVLQLVVMSLVMVDKLVAAADAKVGLCNLLLSEHPATNSDLLFRPAVPAIYCSGENAPRSTGGPSAARGRDSPAESESVGGDRPSFLQRPRARTAPTTDPEARGGEYFEEEGESAGRPARADAPVCDAEFSRSSKLCMQACVALSNLVVKAKRKIREKLVAEADGAPKERLLRDPTVSTEFMQYCETLQLLNDISRRKMSVYDRRQRTSEYTMMAISLREYLIEKIQLGA